MIQSIIVILLFAGALGYLGWVISKQLQAKSSCATGCGKCNVFDPNKIEKQIRANMSVKKD
jgi:dTDP-4-dehydrorhamnose reductase